MTDYFAALNFERTPWLDAESVKARFLELSAQAHPDRAAAGDVATANDKFSELNKAASVLREHRERIQHLLELETGETGVATQNIPEELIEMFGKVGASCRSVDEFLAARAKTTSPMLQAQLFAQGLDWSDRLSELQATVGGLKQKAEAELKTISTTWPDEKPLTRLRELAHAFATIAKWEKQLQERFASLAA